MKENPAHNLTNLILPGNIIADRFEVVSILGKGGMGVVLKAADLAANGKSVAIKILDPTFFQNPTIRARFEREADVGETLVHPNIVRVYTRGLIDNFTSFICMEYVEGDTLATWIERAGSEGIIFSDVMFFFSQIVSGIAYAHAAGVIHRDINPANIIITAEDEVKIADFGIARLEESAEKLTRTFESMGTSFYTAPEQLLGGKVDARSDIYSLGVAAREMATGTVTRSGETPKSVSHWFLELINRATEGNPDDRFQSVDELGVCLSRGMRKENHFQTESGSNWPSTFTQIAAGSLLATLVAAGGYFVFNL